MNKQTLLDNAICVVAQIAGCLTSNEKEKGIKYCNILILEIYSFVNSNYNSNFLYELTKSKQDKQLLDSCLESKYFTKYYAISGSLSYLLSFAQNGAFLDLIDFCQRIELIRHYFTKLIYE